MPDDTNTPAEVQQPIEALRAAAEDARQQSTDLAAAVEAVTADVRVRNGQTGAERTVGAAAVPFFTNQGYELVDEPGAAPETPGRHEGN
jgi:hypothetical protein